MPAFRMKPAEFLENVTSPGVIYAFGTSLLTALIAALINSVFGLILAWVLNIKGLSCIVDGRQDRMGVDIGIASVYDCPPVTFV